MGRLSLHACAASALLLLAAVVALAACGQEGEQSDVAPASSNMLHVRVAGMVQSDGITWLGWPATVLGAVRVLPAVARAAFDIPTETFTIELHSGADGAPVLAAITALGYTPETLETAPAAVERAQRLDSPTSKAVRDGLARAKARGVPLVVAHGGPFCRLCQLFEETTLEDERVRTALDAVEFLQIDVELDPAAARDFDVHGVPDFWLLDGEGKVLARMNAYLDPDEFLAFLGLAQR